MSVITHLMEKRGKEDKEAKGGESILQLGKDSSIAKGGSHLDLT